MRFLAVQLYNFSQLGLQGDLWFLFSKNKKTSHQTIVNENSSLGPVQGQTTFDEDCVT